MILFQTEVSTDCLWVVKLVTHISMRSILKREKKSSPVHAPGISSFLSEPIAEMCYARISLRMNAM